MAKTVIPEGVPGNPVLRSEVRIPGKVQKKYRFSKRGRAAAYVFEFKSGHTLLRDRHGLNLVFFYKDKKVGWEWIREHVKQIKRTMV